MHHVGRFAAQAPSAQNRHADHSQGLGETILVDSGVGAVHTHLALNELAQGGVVDMHMHSFEEGFYLLDGEAVVAIDDEAIHMSAGDFGALKPGAVHGWRTVGSAPVRWL